MARGWDESALAEFLFNDEHVAVDVLAGNFHEGDTIVVEPSGDTLRFKKDVPATVAS